MIHTSHSWAPYSTECGHRDDIICIYYIYYVYIIAFGDSITNTWYVLNLHMCSVHLSFVLCHGYVPTVWDSYEGSCNFGILGCCDGPDHCRENMYAVASCYMSALGITMCGYS